MAQSVRHHSAGGTEGALGVLSQLAMMGCAVVLGSSILEQRRSEKKIIKIKQERMERESTQARKDNTNKMFVKWHTMSPSREAVLNETYKNNWYFNLHKLFGMANKSKADETTRAIELAGDVIWFFILWKSLDDDGEIDSVDLKERLGSQFFFFRKILKEISGEEAKDWHQADLNNLNKVVAFLDKISKMETEG